ncbi:MAG: YbaN family protein, partial [Candidatus Bathyarchaeota archaeon]
MPPSSSRRWLSSQFKKILFAVGGTVFLVLGCVGILLPILPTTPFLLLSATCYYKSSDRMHRWMLNNRIFKSYIRNYKEGNGISLKAKAFTI